jgi:hypothetical protein
VTLPHLSHRATASAAWRKSTHSGGGGNACVEVAPLTVPDVIGVRDSKDVTRPPMSVAPTAWTSFLTAIAD